MPTVVLIAGLGRSGSTVLESLLANRLGAVAVGETRYLWGRGLLRGELCSCGTPVNSCPFWLAVVERAYGADEETQRSTIATLQDYFHRNRRLLPLLGPLRLRQFRRELDVFGRVMPPLFEAIAAVAQRDVVIDSSKNAGFGLALHGSTAVRLVVVHVVRDSRGVVHSWQRRRRRPEVHWEEEYMDRLPPLRTAVIWMVQNAAIEVLGRRSRRYTRVRYEDFVADPQSALDRIALMCQAAGADVPSEPEVEPVVHSVAGNPVRFDRGPLQLTADVSWSEQMPTWQRRAVTAISAPMLLRYGYRLTVPAGHARR